MWKRMKDMRVLSLRTRVPDISPMRVSLWAGQGPWPGWARGESSFNERHDGRASNGQGQNQGTAPFLETSLHHSDAWVFSNTHEKLVKKIDCFSRFPKVVVRSCLEKEVLRKGILVMGRQWGPACPEGKVLIFQVSSSVFPVFRSTSSMHAETPVRLWRLPEVSLMLPLTAKVGRVTRSSWKPRTWYRVVLWAVLWSHARWLLGRRSMTGLLSLWMKSCFGVKTDCFTSDPHSSSIAAPTRVGSLDCIFHSRTVLRHTTYIYQNSYASLLLQNSLYSICHLIKIFRRGKI